MAWECREAPGLPVEVPSNVPLLNKVQSASLKDGFLGLDYLDPAVGALRRREGDGVGPWASHRVGPFVGKRVSVTVAQAGFGGEDGN